jgi:hypothetical protein
MLAVLFVAPAACGSQERLRQGRLYPANDVAATSGVLTLEYVSRGTGAGPITIVMPNGETMQGEYTIVRGGGVGFGSIFATVYGPQGSASGVATSTSHDIPGGSPGVASLFGDRGTSMQCEFYNDNISGHGYGACRSSNGAVWRLQY